METLELAAGERGRVLLRLFVCFRRPANNRRRPVSRQLQNWKMPCQALSLSLSWPLLLPAGHIISCPENLNPARPLIYISNPLLYSNTYIKGRLQASGPLRPRR